MNSFRFYEDVKNFQNERKKIIDQYEKKMSDLQPMAGSQYFTEESEKAEKEKTQALNTLVARYDGDLRRSIKKMKSTNAKRKLEAPTEEQLRLLSTLKMKDSLSAEELLSAANTVSDNSLALSVVHELAEKNNVHANIFQNSTSLPIGQVDKLLSDGEEKLRDFLLHDSTLASRKSAKHNLELYGTPYNEKDLPKRRLFENRDECFASFFGTNSFAFYKAVDD